MLEVKVEGLDELLKKFEAFDKQIEDLHKEVPQQLVEWQTEDTRRKYPNIKVDETEESVEASTEIWPRSRLELEPGFKRPRPTVKKGPTMARIKGVGRPPPSTRPLLRTELFTKLVDRMTRAVNEAMKWP
ncbi:hypothetical protein NLM33_32985 [Bradyrhizobium sp. CCGUVB1N3]|uniref:hypothetical protein n=1 Tax=Bradyrhizobium sp. CCGUVB1N3 TaxID=2949629 RepID=UPI0020B1BD0B|nr:hypothetical protein [Bradyrhizobium sp. CCGUVB1N3]MCP3475141.1 hypothetical protein [Bradyrhizobium sp. CCGUVB1N3]